MNAAFTEEEAQAAERIKRRFLAITGLRSVRTDLDTAGPDRYLAFQVGRDAPMYRYALDEINRSLDEGDPFHGSLRLSKVRTADPMRSQEVELLRALLERSLRVTSANLEAAPRVEFAPFRSGEEVSVTQAANHVIEGRRGVGKSTLILMAYRRVLEDGNLPVWLDLKPMRGASGPNDLLVMLSVVLGQVDDTATTLDRGADTTPLVTAQHLVEEDLLERGITERNVRTQIPKVNTLIKDFARLNATQIYVFLDDVHLLSSDLQPLLFDLLHGSFKGAGAWLKIAGLKQFLKLYDPARKIGLQRMHDVQAIDLDLTLVEPAQARKHLVSILTRFVNACGFRKCSSLIPERAIERLVWCSAGVPRDFLSLFNRAVGHAIEHNRRRVGVEEVNLSVGESAQTKMDELGQDTSEDADAVRHALDTLQSECLDHHRSNSFLMRQAPQARGYELLQKLVDLRLVHLIHPSITPGRAGERYEAYLLDYSFYTGVRRRHRLNELRITPEGRPKWAALRRLPQIEPQVLEPG